MKVVTIFFLSQYKYGVRGSMCAVLTYFVLRRFVFNKYSKKVILEN